MSQFDIIRDKVTALIKGNYFYIIVKPCGLTLLFNCTPIEILERDIIPEDPKPVNDAKIMYRACMDTGNSYSFILSWLRNHRNKNCS